MINSRSQAPVALFVYNRPIHTRRTVESLLRNTGAQDSILHIFSDAAKTTQESPSVDKVRIYLKEITGFKQVLIYEQVNNLGLAKSIINGVSTLCEKYGNVIVLEDDIVTSPYFLTYMNESLNFYENVGQVMHISAFRYPVKPFETEDTFFLRVPLCWGWATWQRAWKFYNKDVSLMSHFNQNAIRRFNFDNNYDFWMQLVMNKSGYLNTWFIFWYANLFLCNGLALFPARSLVQNIGMDKSGTHSGISNDYNVKLSETKILLSDIPLCESTEAYEFHRRYFKKIKIGLIQRGVQKVCKIFLPSK